jgi:hypothetical protein
MSIGNRDVAQAGVALLAEDFRFARIHGNHPIAVPLQVEGDEIARAQAIVRQADDRDRLRAVQDALNEERILISAQIE